MPDAPRSFYFPLFEHMSREHGLTLLDSELDEIVRVVKSLSKKPPKVKPAPSERGLRFAEWFAGTLEADADKGTGWREKWARVFDELIADGKTAEEIAAVCKWARAHSFWQDKFRAPTKLRKRDAAGATFYDRFRAAMSPGRGAQLVRSAGQEKEGASSAKTIEFK